MSSHTKTKQLAAWQAEFGREYTDRNLYSVEEIDRLLGEYRGVRQSEIFRQLLPLQGFSAGRVLEVGCNIGNQLKIFDSVFPGFELYGIDPQKYALAKGHTLTPGINFLMGSAFHIPFKDGMFDLVMTNGVLIHIHPDNLLEALREIYRTSNRFIFCNEYFSEQPCEINYRGNTGLLWKMNYMQLYLDNFPDLKCLEARRLHHRNPHTDADLIDQVCLLEKGSS
jgi:pseudaminic acid biosynthesis-associated methylase